MSFLFLFNKPYLTLSKPKHDEQLQDRKRTARARARSLPKFANSISAAGVGWLAETRIANRLSRSLSQTAL